MDLRFLPSLATALVAFPDFLAALIGPGVHDAHGLGGDTSVGVDLLQNLVNVDGVGFPACLLRLFLGTVSIKPSSFRHSSCSSSLLGRLGSDGGRFTGTLGWHDDDFGISGNVRRRIAKAHN